jgi:hypothetical protein
MITLLGASNGQAERHGKRVEFAREVARLLHDKRGVPYCSVNEVLDMDVKTLLCWFQDRRIELVIP